MKKLLIVTLVFFSTIGYSQKVKIEGNLKFLKGEKSIKTEFDYSQMGVGKFEKERDYLDKRKGELEEKEAGRGEKFETAWFADRKDRFEPQFRELFAKHSSMSSVGEGAKYGMIVKTVFTEPGWNVGVMRVPAFINLEVLFFELSAPDKIIAKVFMSKIPGRDAWGFDFDTGTRLQEAYAKGGKELGQLIVKQNK